MKNKLQLHRYNIQNLICIFLILIFWLLFYLPLIAHISYAVVDNDWYQSYYYADAFRKSILECHQFPLGTPFMAGGYPLIDHPFYWLGIPICFVYVSWNIKDFYFKKI